MIILGHLVPHLQRKHSPAPAASKRAPAAPCWKVATGQGLAGWSCRCQGGDSSLGCTNTLHCFYINPAGTDGRRCDLMSSNRLCLLQAVDVVCPGQWGPAAPMRLCVQFKVPFLGWGAAGITAGPWLGVLLVRIGVRYAMRRLRLEVGCLLIRLLIRDHLERPLTTPSALHTHSQHPRTCKGR